MPKKNYYLESVLDLNASNVWGIDAQELLELWQKDIKEEGFSASEDKVLNIIRLAFEVYHFDPKDDREVLRYNNGDYVILPGVDKHKGAVAIRKKEIRRITDLSYENIKHVTAFELLKLIEGNFGGGWDSISLAIKDIPLHTLIVTSVLRTEHDVRRLRRFNTNASEASCHRFGTTFDISYNRYHTVSPPGGPERRAVRSDTLKWVLSEVLRDLREDGLCYVKYEVKQGCFHITVR